MDVLYPVKKHENNDELRYSLRSLKNLPHDKVFFAGFKPSWVNDKVLHIPVDQGSLENKYVKSIGNLIAALEDERLSDDFILMNDDFFILQPINYMPTLHRGYLIDMANDYYKKHSASPYTQGLLATLKRLQHIGIENPLSYELHVPMVFNKAKLRETLEISKELGGFGKRTIYGNLNKLGGDYFDDVKYTNARRPIFPDMPFISTDEGSFMYHPVGDYIRMMFREQSEYEIRREWV